MATYLSSFDFNGERLFTIVLLLLFFYLLLNLFEGFLRGAKFLGKWHEQVHNAVHQIFILYEPIAFLLMAGSLVLINPIFFGLIAIILLFTVNDHLRNYMSGRLVQFDKVLTLGNQIRTGNHQGVISRISRFGIRLKTAKGLQFITYPQLLEYGYTITTGDDLGGFYRLTISQDSEEETIPVSKLRNFLAAAPYLDWRHDTEITQNFENPRQVETRVLLHEDHHLPDLVSLIQEWGYLCKVSKK